MAKNNRELLRSLLPALDSPAYRDEELDKLTLYAELLLKWNKAFNLVGRNDFQSLVADLFVDSVHLARFLNRLAPNFADSTWDVGAGAGLPGIPLRVFWENGDYLMIEAREKRALFIANALALLHLPRTTVLRSRLEDFLATNPPKANCVLSRAFMPWPELLKIFARRIDGFLVVLASQPPGSLPWRLIDQYSFPVGEKTRWLWAVAP